MILIGTLQGRWRVIWDTATVFRVIPVHTEPCRPKAARKYQKQVVWFFFNQFISGNNY